MRRARPPGVLAAVRALAALAALAAFGCARQQSRPQPAVTPSAGATLAATAPASPAPTHPAAPGGMPLEVTSHRVGSRYIVWTKQKANRKLYVLRADSEAGAYSGTNTGRSTFVNPHVTFFGTAGKRVVADAPAGTVVEKDKTVTMERGVRARMQDGTTLMSERLRYDDETDMLHGEGNVVVTFPGGEELRGETLDWNLRSGSIDVTGAR